MGAGRARRSSSCTRRRTSTRCRSTSARSASSAFRRSSATSSPRGTTCGTTRPRSPTPSSGSTTVMAGRLKGCGRMTDDLDVIVLAAGLGTRMKSRKIKILHRAAGRPIIDYVLDVSSEICARPPVLVVGHQREAVQESVGDHARYAVQEQQLGTGHAVMRAAKMLHESDANDVLILSGDVPLTR